ncbi:MULTISPECIES: protein phosphatase 2C domain-containing protein [unclassified Nocardioides]|uniref:protein phosphatase 2C domain-containing protein n=1 Tax=unclassified Nocardioides TaxID=2615069 RepID=UPI000AF04F0E|nr:MULTISPECIES: protein phosphatase 2C domain-containing protein [unclassified Nocardioides]
MPDNAQSATARTVEVAGFGNENTRGQGAGYQDRWGVGSGATGSWLAVADGIGGGPAGQEAAEVALGLVQVVLGAGEPSETRLHQLFDSVYVALRPWWAQERGGGTTLTVAAISDAGLWMAAVGDSPAYVDFGSGYEMVTEPKQSHQLKEWLGSEDRPRPWVELWRRPEHEIRGVIVTSDGVDASAVTSLAANRTAGDVVGTLRELPSVGGDDASAAVAVFAPPIGTQALVRSEVR